MNRLPPEIKNEIVQLALDSYYSTWDQRKIKEYKVVAALYATVSREWQAHIEPITFRELFLNQGRLQYAQAKGIITSARQSYIRHIEFTALLPATSLSGNNEVFSKNITELLGLMKSWQSPHGSIELSLRTTLAVHDKDDGFYWDDAERSVGLWRNAYRQLPEVPSITRFNCPTSDWQMHLEPLTCCEIASRFPNLHTIDWTLCVDYPSHCGIVRYPTLAMERRKIFAMGISMLPRSIREISIRDPGKLNF